MYALHKLFIISKVLAIMIIQLTPILIG